MSPTYRHTPAAHKATADILRAACSRAIWEQDPPGRIADVRRSAYVEAGPRLLVISGEALDNLVRLESEGAIQARPFAYLDGRVLYTPAGKVSTSGAARLHVQAYWAAQVSA